MSRDVTFRHAALAAGLMLVLSIASGCSTTGTGQIPLGRWSGTGTFAYESWQENHVANIHRDYPTHLDISRTTLDGHDVILVDILSERGQVEDMGEQSHLRFALEPAERRSDTILLYRIVDLEFNPDADDELSYKPAEPTREASCISTGRATILQIDYNDNFADTYRFEGLRLHKMGTYYQHDSGMIHWTETLHRR